MLRTPTAAPAARMVGSRISPPPWTIPKRRDQDGREHRRHRRPAEARRQRADPGAEDDVGGPEEAGGERQRHSRQVDSCRRRGRRGGRFPPRRAPPRAGPGGRREPKIGHPERADELEGDGDPQRQPLQRRVEEEVDGGDRPASRKTSRWRPLPRPQRRRRGSTPPAPARRRRHGRKTAPAAPISSKRLVASAEPHWTATIEASTSSAALRVLVPASAPPGAVPVIAGF